MPTQFLGHSLEKHAFGEEEEGSSEPGRESCFYSNTRTGGARSMLRLSRFHH
jgi:hypothetical protein